MPETESRATKNRLLSLLTDEERARLSPSLGRAVLHEGDVIFHMGESVRRAYFPDGGVISVVCASAGGESVEVGMVGYEGVAGLPALLGDGVPHNKRAVVQVAGRGRMIEAGALRREFKLGGHFQGVLLRYAQAYHTLVSQSVFCQAFHKIDERLARWLLECRWRTESDELPLTQEYVAEIIGVRRASVTEAAGRLTNKGVITHARGAIMVADSEGLEAVACECHGIIRAEFERLFGS